MASLADVGVWENYINAPTHIHKTRWVNLFIPQPISNCQGGRLLSYCAFSFVDTYIINVVSADKLSYSCISSNVFMVKSLQY